MATSIQPGRARGETYIDALRRGVEGEINRLVKLRNELQSQIESVDTDIEERRTAIRRLIGKPVEAAPAPKPTPKPAAKPAPKQVVLTEAEVRDTLYELRDRESFAIDDVMKVLGLGRSRTRDWLTLFTQKGMLKIVKPGGSGRGNVTLWAFVKPEAKAS